MEVAHTAPLALVRVFKINWVYKTTKGELIRNWEIEDTLYGDKVKLEEKEIPMMHAAGRHFQYLAADFLRERGFLITQMCASGDYLICHEVRHNRTLTGHRSKRAVGPAELAALLVEETLLAEEE